LNTEIKLDAADL